ncbi:hypothetical protein BU26DRAFT_611479 [Trematosphaeria pertusa]|uniref:Uncharacterized protein n=1 Tax=Trematosphaeria pertusa TaxID=390896 RepID=A0A6A6HS23_9PLEO|nr:uncharacterized protein BU26DRAFT_611479 [Trematosphaeria pertusa]KAF2240608.1 hypothetical protein BU26DRAFT_611479 [Trematosphaeria pertusa]
MASFVQNILWNSVEGFVEAGKRTAGGYAGDALIKAGDLVENSGRNIGDGLERRASNYSTAISGQTYQPSAKALPSTARKPSAVKRSNSSPASTKAVGPSSRTPLGANKYPGGKQVGSAAKKQITSGATGAKSAVGGGAKSAAATAKSSLPKAYPNNVPYGTKITPTSSSSSSYKPLYGGGGNSGPSAPEKKTAVKPGQPKPFNAGGQKDEKKQTTYPGTNTLPGQGGKAPVTAKKYKPMERMAPPAERGKMQHIAV